ncbi:glucose PTS transporter subunit IIA [Streptococcus ratti]|uniref:PTS system, beta-glucoside-specific IIABC component n=1 Tax=Streptococcus ratti FA-1 = DSM 20564 TaxID=699248 RepID=A0ABN0GSH1_STRRT|nr:glucose PTS transporter subunit IIA [Streptococcus ratti]EJN93229.1 PTS system, beta-glucoside-specific IIABC component [Streptococcus ratti FA-1 = DSM 20564]EMP69504.1 PTS system beta-glucosides-specific transporter subunit IIABC [Streptococcus ratti FA-1 = DSM 20564]QEY06808.1 PTS beta-glucoside transporter subunit EIIBCA [Streptococcus ratti]VEI59219.1 PTS system beta-glucosides-specific transporter subunit IIABC [Streptococcus mutans]
MDYNKLAQGIVLNVGGAANVEILSHCMTRLRFSLKDATKADKKALEALDGVIGVVYAGGQYMVILGENLLPVYDAILHDFDIKTGGVINENLDGDLKQKEPLTWGNALNKTIGFISSTVTPMIPGLIAGGMLKVALLLVVTFISANYVNTSSYQLISAIADAPFYFMPIFVAYGAATKLGGTQIYAMAAAASLLHGNFTALVTAAKPISLFGLPVNLLSYGTTLLPAVLIAIVAYYAEKLLNKIIPNIFKAIFVGMGTIFIAGSLGFLILGPLGNYIGRGIAALFMWLDGTIGALAVGLLAAALPWMVMAGMHTAITPFMPQLISDPGYDSMLRPAFLMHNMAEGGAVLGVTARTKDKMKRSEYLSIAIGCIVAGVTEPAIYGVNLKYKKPMYAVMAGGFAGSLVASLLGVRAYVMGYSNILSLPIFKETAMAAAVGILVSIAVAAVVAFVLNIDNEDSEKTTEPVKVEVADDAIVAVADGQLLALEAVADEVFSSKMMGDGVALSPESDFIVAPANGKLTTVFPTGHAFGLTRADGVEILVHVGINTVELKGQGFDVLAKQGDLVRAGQPIVKIDREALVRKGYDITTIMVVTDSKGKHISLRHEGKIKSGTIL